MNTSFKNNGQRKRRRCDRNIHKAMQIPVNIGNFEIKIT